MIDDCFIHFTVPTRPCKQSTTLELVPPHPLVGSHVIVRRSKLAVPLLAGSPSPHQPKASAAPRVARKAWGEWSCYYAALLIPWGCRGSASASTLTDEHHAPRLRVVDLLAWWRCMELRSVVAWARVLLQPTAADDAVQARWKLKARRLDFRAVLNLPKPNQAFRAYMYSCTGQHSWENSTGMVTPAS
jgi:hypothetical protein